MHPCCHDNQPAVAAMHSMLLLVTEDDVGRGGMWEGGVGGALMWVVFVIDGSEAVRREGVGVCDVEGGSDIVQGEHRGS